MSAYSRVQHLRLTIIGCKKSGRKKKLTANPENDSSEPPNSQETRHRRHDDGDYNIGRIIQDVGEPQFLQIPQRRGEVAYPAEYPREYGHLYVYICVFSLSASGVECLRTAFASIDDASMENYDHFLRPLLIDHA
ncbi:hypothetical protein SAY87_030002 [Trapa incisa]|uniref:Uncharacterized protein n=1 Tax=Trapa incisa TaxID=236973 RepID=A0AAN7K5F7_9MYRT|nr:hypothetical protein SAY87_030002 [Trapa incisa]